MKMIETEWYVKKMLNCEEGGIKEQGMGILENDASSDIMKSLSLLGKYFWARVKVNFHNFHAEKSSYFSVRSVLI